ncbi:VWA domain-containing protein [Kribbella shirazensis]|uniref:Tight adherence protein B n=1 Tax=Kribbella shirazensis TaxID=1105143 RepID=A0A7X5VEK1_9ACTN|nr:VWA domain-containing protein [Kribbella shirazensis]NIK59092.1 tight adherence protein B [Kribbella shirazensis]
MSALRRTLTVLLGGVVLTFLSGTAHAGGDPVAHIDSVQVGPGTAGFVLSTANVSGRLDSQTVQVVAGRTVLPSRVTPVSNATTAAAPQRAVMIVLDTSGSMAGSGIAAARQAALSYLADLPSDVEAGLLTFADQPRLVVGPTTNRASVRDALTRVQASGATTLYDAVNAAVSAFDAARLGPSTQRRLVVLSDGVDTSSTAKLVSVTRRLSDAGVPADVVAFRYGKSDASAARQVASAAGGRVLAAQNAGELTAAFAAVARSFTARAKVDVTVPDVLAGRTVTLRVNVGSASTTTTLTFATIPSAKPAVPADRAVWSGQLVGLLAGVFAVLLLVVLLLRRQGVRRDNARRLVEQMRHYGPHHEEAGESEGPAAQTALGVVGEVLRAAGADQGLARRLDLANLKRTPAEWAALTLSASAVLAVGLVLSGLDLLLSLPIGLVVGWIGQHVYLSIRAGRRRAAFGEQLPDVLQLIVGSLRSGFSLAQAVDAVVRDGTQPAADEFSRALAETRIGVELEDGLDRVAARMECDDLRWVVMATRIQREVGGNLAEVLRNTIDTMRERAKIRRHIRAVSAEGRLSGYIIVALPLALGTWLTLSKPQYMQPLFSSPIGWLLVAGGAALIVVGALWIRVLIKVEA